jgi:hypothetical protein
MRHHPGASNHIHEARSSPAPPVVSEAEGRGNAHSSRPGCTERSEFVVSDSWYGKILNERGVTVTGSAWSKAAIDPHGFLT